MKKGYPTNQNLETNQLKPQETNLLEDSYINHDVLNSDSFSLHFSSNSVSFTPRVSVTNKFHTETANYDSTASASSSQSSTITSNSKSHIQGHIYSLIYRASPKSG